MPFLNNGGLPTQECDRTWEDANRSYMRNAEALDVEVGRFFRGRGEDATHQSESFGLSWTPGGVRSPLSWTTEVVLRI